MIISVMKRVNGCEVITSLLDFSIFEMSVKRGKNESENIFGSSTFISSHDGL